MVAVRIRPRQVAVIACALCAKDLEAQAVCSLEWTLEETLRIGSIDGEDALSWFGNLEIGPAGEVYVPQRTLGSVMVFSPEGELLRTFGREGSGPGDFEAGPRGVTWVGEDLWVADRFRAQSFGPEGRVRDFVSFQEWVPNEGTTFRPDAPLADGSFWPRRTVSPVPNGYAQLSTLALRRFTRDGEVIDTIAVLDVTDRRIVTDPRTGGFTVHPFWRFLPPNGLHQIVTADRSAVVLIGEVREEPGSASFDLLRISISGDTLLRRSIPYEPLRIGRADEAWWFREFAAVMAGDSAVGRAGYLQLGQAARNRAREAAREAFWLPEYYPPVRQILAGADDTTWLLREFSVLEPEDRWEVYDSEGVLIGRVTDAGRRARFTPWLPWLTILRASRTEVWATTIDDLDVPYLHRYRVDRGCQ